MGRRQLRLWLSLNAAAALAVLHVSGSSCCLSAASNGEEPSAAVEGSRRPNRLAWVTSVVMEYKKREKRKERLQLGKQLQQNPRVLGSQLAASGEFLCKAAVVKELEKTIGAAVTKLEELVEEGSFAAKLVEQCKARVQFQNFSSLDLERKSNLRSFYNDMSELVVSIDERSPKAVDLMCTAEKIISHVGALQLLYFLPPSEETDANDAPSSPYQTFKSRGKSLSPPPPLAAVAEGTACVPPGGVTPKCERKSSFLHSREHVTLVASRRSLEEQIVTFLGTPVARKKSFLHQKSEMRRTAQENVNKARHEAIGRVVASDLGLGPLDIETVYTNSKQSSAALAEDLSNTVKTVLSPWPRRRRS